MTEDEIAGWHHTDLMDMRVFEQAMVVGDGQGILACCSPWGCRVQSQLSNWTELITFIDSYMLNYPRIPGINIMIMVNVLYNVLLNSIFLLLYWQFLHVYSPGILICNCFFSIVFYLTLLSSCAGLIKLVLKIFPLLQYLKDFEKNWHWFC